MTKKQKNTTNLTIIIEEYGNEDQWTGNRGDNQDPSGTCQGVQLHGTDGVEGADMGQRHATGTQDPSGRHREGRTGDELGARVRDDTLHRRRHDAPDVRERSGDSGRLRAKDRQGD